MNMAVIKWEDQNTALERITLKGTLNILFFGILSLSCYFFLSQHTDTAIPDLLQSIVKYLALSMGILSFMIGGLHAIKLCSSKKKKVQLDNINHSLEFSEDGWLYKEDKLLIPFTLENIKKIDTTDTHVFIKIKISDEDIILKILTKSLSISIPITTFKNASLCPKEFFQKTSSIQPDINKRTSANKNTLENKGFSEDARPVNNERLYNTAISNLSLSVGTVTILSIIGLGIFNFFWWHDKWRCIKKTESKNIFVFIRALFPIFFYKNYLQTLNKMSSMPVIRYPTYWAALYWSITILLLSLPIFFIHYNSVHFIQFYLLLLSCYPLIFIIPIQHAINKMNLKTEKKGKITNSMAHILTICIVVGFCSWNHIIKLTNGANTHASYIHLLTNNAIHGDIDPQKLDLQIPVLDGSITGNT